MHCHTSGDEQVLFVFTEIFRVNEIAAADAIGKERTELVEGGVGLIS